MFFLIFSKHNGICVFGGILMGFSEFRKMGWENRDFPENTLNLTPMG